MTLTAGTLGRAVVVRRDMDVQKCSSMSLHVCAIDMADTKYVCTYNICI